MDETMNSSTTSSLDQQQGETATEKVADAAGAVTDTVQSTAGAVVDTAQDAAGAVADKVQDVTSAVSSRVDQVADAAASKVEGLADTVFQTALSADAPEAQRRVAETTANVLDKSAQYLREGDLGLMFEDLRGVVRRHPLRSLALGLGLGYVARGMIFGNAPATPKAGSRGSQFSQPRMVPVYGSEFATDTYSFDTGTSTATSSTMPAAPMPTVDIAPLATDTMFTGTLGNDVSYGTDAEIGGATDIDTFDAIATDTDTMSTSSFGASTIGTSGDISTTNSDVDTLGGLGLGSDIGTTSAEGTLSDFDTTRDVGMTGGDLSASTDFGTSGDSLIGTTGVLSSDVGSTTTDFGGSLDSLGAQGGSIAGEIDDTSVSTGSEGSLGGAGTTGDTDASDTTTSGDVLQSWDSQTRKRRR